MKASGPSALVDTGFEPEEETYQNACKVLHDITARTIHSNDYNVRRSGPGWSFTESIPYCLSLLGYSMDDLDRLSPIQITATKGKGSTAAFTSAILQRLGKHADGSIVRVGRFTGPYYVSDRDQIAINGLPVSEELFNYHFWRLWNKLRAAEDPSQLESYRKPVYFSFIFVLAMIIFLEEGVDVAVIEVFCGGRHDTTSVIQRPLVVSVGSIAVDHPGELGPTEEHIAWQKAGLYKPGCAAITIRQEKANLNAIIAQEAHIAKANSFTVLEKPFAEVEDLSLGISGNKSALNASLAIMIVQAFLSHPNRPTAFTLRGRALRAPKSKHTNIAHDSVPPVQFEHSVRSRIARMTPDTGKATLIYLAMTIVTMSSTLFPNVASWFSHIERLLPALTNHGYYITYVLQIAGCCLLFMIWSYNSYAPKSGWTNPLILQAPLPSVRVSKHLVGASAVAEAIQSVRFPGRGDIVPDTKVKGLEWLMEAAHTPCSMPVQAVWADSVWSKEPSAKKVLLVMVEPYRPAKKMFAASLEAFSEGHAGKQVFDHVIFFNDVVYRDSYQYDPELKLLEDLEQAWSAACSALRLPKTEKTHSVATIEDAVDLTRQLAEKQGGGPMYALTFSVWPGDVHLAARLPVDFGDGCTTVLS